MVTTAIPDALVRKQEGVPIWVIILAVVAGVILLSLLIVCLWKVYSLSYFVFTLIAVSYTVTTLVQWTSCCNIRIVLIVFVSAVTLSPPILLRLYTLPY